MRGLVEGGLSAYLAEFSAIECWAIECWALDASPAPGGVASHSPAAYADGNGALNRHWMQRVSNVHRAIRAMDSML